MQPTVATIKALRERTGAGIMDCKKALLEAEGDLDHASEILKREGLALVKKKVSRVASQGLIEVYVHGAGRIGAMVEVNCETDFVARTSELKELAHNLAMQVAAMEPTFVSDKDIPQGEEIEPSQACLLLQPFIKDPQKSVQQVITETVAKVGENIQVRRFARFELGRWEDE